MKLSVGTYVVALRDHVGGIRTGERGIISAHTKILDHPGYEIYWGLRQLFGPSHFKTSGWQENEVREISPLVILAEHASDNPPLPLALP